MVSATSTITTQDTLKLAGNVEKLKIVQYDDKTLKEGSYKAVRYATRVLGEDGILRLTEEEAKDLKFPEYAPTWDTNEHYEPYELIEHPDRALNADPNLPNLLPKGIDHYVTDLTPKFGSEVTGVQLSELSNDGKNELALLVAKRGVVVFRDQDLAEKGVEFNHNYATYFGPLHIHPASGSPEGYPTLHLVYKAKDVHPHDSYLRSHTSTHAWHSDVSYEKQPPSYTFLSILEGPKTGGDTVFVDAETAYERLSPTFREILEGLSAVHSGFEQAANSKNNGGITRRDPVANTHPIVRTHPVTGKKSLYINKQFTRDIVGLKKEESDTILNFLYDHLSSSVDLHARAKWGKGTVVVWDNRKSSHTALFDWDTDERRHLYRLASRAEVPYLDKSK